MKLQPRLLATSLGILIASTCAAAPTPMMSAPATQSAAASAALVTKLAQGRMARGLDNNHGFTLTRQHPGIPGTQVVRAAHTYKGLRVFGSESVVVVDAAGAIVSESAATRRLHLGRGPANRLGAATQDFNVKPLVPPKAAIDAAVGATLSATGPDAVHIVPPTAELLIYPVMKMERLPGAVNKLEGELNALDVQEVVDRYELAYLVRTRMQRGDHPHYDDTVVSARDARIIDRWSALQTVVGVGKSQYNGEVPVSTTFSDGSYRMLDPERGTGGTYGAMAITNANNSSKAGDMYTNASNTWGDGKQYVRGGSTTDANGQTAAVNAMWGLMNTYDALKNVLGWQSLDGKNTATYIAVHVNTAYDNAYYSDTCRCMFIGDGSSFTSLGSIDVIGHEMGHGVTAATSDLVYSGESGGLNESSSDIGGEVVEAYARAGGTGEKIPASGNDWMLGTEIARDGQPLRWMYRPSKDGSSPDAWSTALRRLDVHYSSGPNNRMFYFLAQGSKANAAGDYYSTYLVKSPQAMTGIGLDAAFRIWFKANTTKFTASTNYADARAKMIEAAQELYGAASREAVAVQRAYAAINVGADVDEPVAAEPAPAEPALAATDR
ncbi:MULTISPECIES: M4 family metallopeptidase [unclassified Massilia]|uniref:M4 family metallopeptidase n=1 Tax=unclassified Massilia TaxID=2609279 RepID=UPI00177C19DD|nr:MULTISPECIES: M4 family metallopeptidase [unclassified Massilia]MBD8532131.1 M4 family metallopeptidase [Massilia sp. CFBP 13647]MBD8675611.1 M4 family metallopeptidase [Massilia sp. CFBP 13721]